MITPGQAPLDALRAVMAGEALELPPGWEGPMRASCDALAARLAAGDTMYGVNTGFGKLASTRISDPDLVQLQLNLIRSHAAGVGEPLPDAVVRLVLALKALSLARGASAAQPSTVEALLALLNGNVLPVIPARGSVGASGDLAPLAHLSLVLIGEGQAMELGATVPGAVALKRLGLKPLALGPKEGLALLNGTQVSTALALAGHFAAEDLWRTALVSGALVTETVFARPGMGKLLYDAVMGNDYNLALLALLLVALVTMLATLGADLLQQALDPRLRGEEPR